VVMERTNARTLTADQIGGAVDLTVVDASFIGLALLLDAIAACTKVGGEIIALVKPQFEVGREEANRTKGVIREDGPRNEAISRVRDEMISRKLDVLGQADCVIEGPKGNREAFLYARR
jgi:23S rRNA (cytidine1920-2'-O)/16S rRNA (cytidine1409-2'-O)-methyltransferase